MTDVPPDDSRATDPIASLADAFWEAFLAANPTTATAVGDHRYDDRLEDRSPGGIGAEVAALRALRARVVGADSPDWVTRAELLAEIDGRLVGLESGMEAWSVDPLNGPQVSLPNLTQVQDVGTPDEAAVMVARWRAMGPYLDQEVANLRTGLAAGRTAPVDPVRRTIDQLGALEALRIEDSPLLSPLGADRPGWTEPERERFATELTAAVRDTIQPAFARYRALLEDEILPAARPADRVGVGHLPGGDETYRRLIRVHTTRDLEPEAIHRTGLDEIARIDAELGARGARILGTRDLGATLAALRSDPALHFGTGDEIVATAERSLARARAALPAWFDRLPRAGCEVARIPDHEAPHSTIAYYLWPAPDGSRPGRYYVNVHEPETRPRYEAEALAFHESIPGHHLQIALAQERTDLPAFRRHLGSTAFAEGWGLYSERLADEMGLYTSEHDRFGILSFDAWRACRLVVDTGMHALGWSRDRAIEFMVEHTALARNNIENEVDRYIVWPGQALGYKVGQLEILALRATARARLGAAFDVRAFHDVVLAEGAVSLETLARIVSAWLGRGGGPPASGSA